MLEPELELALALALALVLVLVLDTLGTRPVAAPQRALPLLLAAEPGSSQLRELRLVGRHTRALLLQGGMMVELEGHKKRPQQVQQVLMLLVFGCREHKLEPVQMEEEVKVVAAAAVTTPREEPEEDEEESEEIGHLGVSSSPRGTVFVDGASTGQRTPARRIALEPGRHEVTVFYDDEDQMSEVKHVLIRAGVNTNVFFRLRRTQPSEE